MMQRWFNQELWKIPEFQSAWVRMGIWLFSAIYLWLGSWTGYYSVDMLQYYLFFGGFFVVFASLLASVYVRPQMPSRRFITLLTDITATSLAIFLTHHAISPFYLIYIWIFVSYGTRYGKTLLMVASILSVVAYNIVLLALDEWRLHTFEAFFFLLLLVVLPIYQYSLLRKLHQARQEAERANKARGDFLATMTHELRTPLIGVIGMARLLEHTPLDREQREYLHSIKSSAQLLRALIGDILDFSKIDANKLELDAEPFDLRELVVNVCSTLAPQAQEKRIELICRIDEQIPRELLGDRLRLSQILFNLLGNAIKFTERGEIQLRFVVAPADERLERPYLRVEVADTGIGIPAEKLERIFDMFWQADASISRRFGGAGLGTTVARDLCQLMGGWIDVSSQLGVGTTFSLGLPLLPDQGGNLNVRPPQLEGKRLLIFETQASSLQAHVDAATKLGMDVVPVSDLPGLTAVVDQDFDLVLLCDALEGALWDRALQRLDPLLARQRPILLASYRGRLVNLPEGISALLYKPFIADQLAQVAIGLLVGGRPRAPGESTTPQVLGEPVEASGVHILLAEDNAIAAKVLRTLLSHKGHRVTLVKDGIEAQQAVTQGDHHLALVDLRMPRVDGLEFTRWYRSQEAPERHMPILALTANTAEDMWEQCRQAGMDGFLNKPVEPDELDAVIAQYVQRPGYA